MNCPRCDGNTERAKRPAPVHMPGRTFRAHICLSCGLKFASVQQAIRSNVDADAWLDIGDRPLENTDEIAEIMAEPPIGIAPAALWFGEGVIGHGHPGYPDEWGIDFPAQVTGPRYHGANDDL